MVSMSACTHSLPLLLTMLQVVGTRTKAVRLPGSSLGRRARGTCGKPRMTATSRSFPCLSLGTARSGLRIPARMGSPITTGQPDRQVGRKRKNSTSC